MGDIGFGTTAGGNTILDPHGSYAGFMPKIEKRGNEYFVEDNRGYGPFKGKMHKVSESMAKMQARKASMGMTRYLMPNMSLASKKDYGGLTIEQIPMGPSSTQPKVTISRPMNIGEYNTLAAQAYQEKYGKPFEGYETTGGWDGGNPVVDASRPQVAIRSGMPIDVQGFAASIQARTGLSGEDALKRASHIIGNQFYRHGVKQGYYEPGTYQKQGLKYNIMGTGTAGPRGPRGRNR